MDTRGKVIVYFSKSDDLAKIFNRGLKTFSWKDSGLSVLEMEYIKVKEFKDVPLHLCVSELKKWGGNKISRSIGRMTLMDGDIFFYMDDFYLYINNKLLKIPEFILHRLMLHE